MAATVLRYSTDDCRLEVDGWYVTGNEQVRSRGLTELLL
jgi:hypothetical protein